MQKKKPEDVKAIADYIDELMAAIKIKKPVSMPDKVTEILKKLRPETMEEANDPLSFANAGRIIAELTDIVKSAIFLGNDKVDDSESEKDSAEDDEIEEPETEPESEPDDNIKESDKKQAKRKVVVKKGSALDDDVPYSIADSRVGADDYSKPLETCKSFRKIWEGKNDAESCHDNKVAFISEVECACLNSAPFKEIPADKFPSKTAALKKYYIKEAEKNYPEGAPQFAANEFFKDSTMSAFYRYYCDELMIPLRMEFPENVDDVKAHIHDLQVSYGINIPVFTEIIDTLFPTTNFNTQEKVHLAVHEIGNVFNINVDKLKFFVESTPIKVYLNSDEQKLKEKDVESDDVESDDISKFSDIDEDEPDDSTDPDDGDKEKTTDEDEKLAETLQQKNKEAFIYEVKNLRRDTDKFEKIPAKEFPCNMFWQKQTVATRYNKETLFGQAVIFFMENDKARIFYNTNRPWGDAKIELTHTPYGDVSNLIDSTSLTHSPDSGKPIDELMNRWVFIDEVFGLERDPTVFFNLPVDTKFPDRANEIRDTIESDYPTASRIEKAELFFGADKSFSDFYNKHISELDAPIVYRPRALDSKTPTEDLNNSVMETNYDRLALVSAIKALHKDINPFLDLRANQIPTGLHDLWMTLNEGISDSTRYEKAVEFFRNRPDAIDTYNKYKNPNEFSISWKKVKHPVSGNEYVSDINISDEILSVTKDTISKINNKKEPATYDDLRTFFKVACPEGSFDDNLGCFMNWDKIEAKLKSLGIKYPSICFDLPMLEDAIKYAFEHFNADTKEGKIPYELSKAEEIRKALKNLKENPKKAVEFTPQKVDDIIYNVIKTALDNNNFSLTTDDLDSSDAGVKVTIDLSSEFQKAGFDDVSFDKDSIDMIFSDSLKITGMEFTGMIYNICDRLSDEYGFRSDWDWNVDSFPKFDVVLFFPLK